jgi:hypothetical protein
MWLECQKAFSKVGVHSHFSLRMRRKAVGGVAVVFAVVALIMVFAYVGFALLNLEGGLKMDLSWIVAVSLVVLLTFGVIVFFGEEG